MSTRTVAYACAALSGGAAVVFELASTRLLSLSLGSTQRALVYVLSAFWVGIAIGSYFGTLLAGRTRNSVRGFQVIEAVTAVLGLASCSACYFVPILQAHSPLWFGNARLVAVAILLPPCIAMGASLPMLWRAVGGAPSNVSSAAIYGWNALGGGLGALATGFLLVPWQGITSAVLAAAAANLCASVFALLLPRAERGAGQETELHTTKWGLEAGLLLAGVSGTMCMALEVGLTSYLTMFLGSTGYALSAILGVLLLGIGAGSMLFQRVRARSVSGLVLSALCALSFGVTVSRISLAQLPALQTTFAASVAENQLERVLVAAVALLPFGMCFGWSFAVALRLSCSQRGGFGLTYALNTLLCVIGLWGAAAVGIPIWGTDALVCAFIVVLSLALVAAALFLPPVSRCVAAGAAIAGVGVVAFGPPLSFHELAVATQAWYSESTVNAANSAIVFGEESGSGFVAVIKHREKLLLTNNGFTEASLANGREAPGGFVDVFLGCIPLLFVESPRRALVVGYGFGSTANTLSRAGLQVNAVELEPSVMRAAHAVGAAPNAGTVVEIGDARTQLLWGREKYDIIVSQPSHPWRAGMSHLFSREWCELVSERLAADGASCQWVNLFCIERSTFASVVKTFFSTFADGYMFADPAGMACILVGFNEPRHEALRWDEEYEDVFATIGIRTEEDLVRLIAGRREDCLEQAGEVVLMTDLNLLAEVRMSSALRPSGPQDDPRRFVEECRQRYMARALVR